MDIGNLNHRANLNFIHHTHLIFVSCILFLRITFCLGLSFFSLCVHVICVHACVCTVGRPCPSICMEVRGQPQVSVKQSSSQVYAAGWLTRELLRMLLSQPIILPLKHQFYRHTVRTDFTQTLGIQPQVFTLCSKWLYSLSNLHSLGRFFGNIFEKFICI